MTAEARRRATYEDVLKAPPGHTAQVVFGVLHTHPRPAFAHAGASSMLGAVVVWRVHGGHGGPGGWIIVDEPELHLGDEPDILVPDLAGWRRDRGELPGRDSVWTAIAPDWGCEVLAVDPGARPRGQDGGLGESQESCRPRITRSS